jgi:hypothetical protein
MGSKNDKYLRICYVFIAICCFHISSKAQSADTIVRQDNELIAWAENYIVKTGYMEKHKKGFKVPLSSSFYENLKGWYTIDIIETQDYDTASITLYRLRAGSDINHPVVLKRTTKPNKPSEFKVYGRSADMQSVYKIYLFFDKYTKFSIKTKEYCYNMLLQNYNNFINPHY